MIQIDTTEFSVFFNKLKGASRDIKPQLALWLEQSGLKFLELVQNEIISTGTTNTRTLLQSFVQGDANNVWKLEGTGLTLEVGSALDYSRYVNYGHNKNPAGVERRFVPGYWKAGPHGGEFVYDPSAKTGMILKQGFVEGTHYWEHAIDVMGKSFPDLLEKLLDEWLKSYFG